MGKEGGDGEVSETSLENIGISGLSWPEEALLGLPAFLRKEWGKERTVEAAGTIMARCREITIAAGPLAATLGA